LYTDSKNFFTLPQPSVLQYVDISLSQVQKWRNSCKQ